MYAAKPFVIWSGQLVGRLPQGNPLNLGITSLIFIPLTKTPIPLKFPLQPPTNSTKVDGIISSKGLNAVLEYTKKANAESATQLYANIYNTFRLGE